jgi:hypothetical protein
MSSYLEDQPQLRPLLCLALSPSYLAGHQCKIQRSLSFAQAPTARDTSFLELVIVVVQLRGSFQCHHLEYEPETGDRQNGARS